MPTKELRQSGRGNMYDNKSKRAYLSQENVKNFNRGLRKRMFSTGGRPYAFDSIEGLEKDINDYFNLCDENDTTPSVTSLSLYLGCNRDTIYAHANNPNSPFSEILKRAIECCHAILENGTVDGKVNPVAYIFLSTNYYGMKNSKDIVVTPSQQSEQINNSDTMEAIQKQIEEETVPDADFHED